MLLIKFRVYCPTMLDTFDDVTIPKLAKFKYFFVSTVHFPQMMYCCVFESARVDFYDFIGHIYNMSEGNYRTIFCQMFAPGNHTIRICTRSVINEV